MLVLGLQGSPRKKGNTEYLLSRFMDTAAAMGAQTLTIDVCKRHIEPCKEYTTCEKKGTCPIHDDMESDIYALLRRADVVVPASPVFFYNVTAQLKALIDRSQTLWARKYRLEQTDPKRHIRRGFALSIGATSGKQLFTGVDLTMKYFFDAVGADYQGSLYYRDVEKRGDMARHPTVEDDIAAAVSELLKPFLHRKRVLFIGEENTGVSRMAEAFGQKYGGEWLDIESGGTRPGKASLPQVESIMAERGVDIGFLQPQSAVKIAETHKPEIVIDLSGSVSEGEYPNAEIVKWDTPKIDETTTDPETVCEAIETRVITWVRELKNAAG